VGLATACDQVDPAVSVQVARDQVLRGDASIVHDDLVEALIGRRRVDQDA